MTWIGKLAGAVMILLSCGGFGFYLAASHKKEENSMHSLICALDYMACELQYRLTPLPELCRKTANVCKGELSRLFAMLPEKLELYAGADVDRCMRACLEALPNIPAQTGQALMLLGASLGRFDLQGQLAGLDGVREECRLRLANLRAMSETQLRSYQTLGLCAGAALVILLV